MDFELDAAVFGTPSCSAEAAEETRQALDLLQRQRAYLKQVLHQTTHSLARFYLEIDANYKQLQASKRVREASFARLEVQRKFYDEGRITADRYLDAVSQYSSAIAQEAMFKTTYNIALIALEEARGTLHIGQGHLCGRTTDHRFRNRTSRQLTAGLLVNNKSDARPGTLGAGIAENARSCVNR